MKIKLFYFFTQKNQIFLTLTRSAQGLDSKMPDYDNNRLK